MANSKSKSETGISAQLRRPQSCSPGFANFFIFAGSRYQSLAIEARDMWLSWNRDVADAEPSSLPPGLATDDKLFLNCGSYFLAEGPSLTDFYAQSLDSMEQTAPSFRKMQFVKVRGRPDTPGLRQCNIVFHFFICTSGGPFLSSDAANRAMRTTKSDSRQWVQIGSTNTTSSTG